MGQLALITAALGTGVSILGRQQAAKARQRALELQMQQTKAAETERSTERTRRASEILSTQVARQGASGFALSSPSFSAIQIDSLNQFARDENADSLNVNFAALSAAREARDSQNATFLGSIGDIFNLGNTLFQANIPTAARTQAKKAPVETATPTKRQTLFGEA